MVELCDHRSDAVMSERREGGVPVPAGWYPDAGGQGLRWWNGHSWTDSVAAVDPAAASSGSSAPRPWRARTWVLWSGAVLFSIVGSMLVAIVILLVNSTTC